MPSPSITRIHTIFPAEFPEPWASDWGEDDYGIFMGFTSVHDNFPSHRISRAR